jgi:hypothetical protein
MSIEEPPKGTATEEAAPAKAEKKLTPQELIKHFHGEATSRLRSGAVALHFEVVWHALGSVDKQALLYELFCGTVQSEGVYAHDVKDPGHFVDIDRPHWAGITTDEIQGYIAKFGSLSLTIDEDTQTGIGHILLKRCDTLLELLDYSETDEAIDLRVSEIAWYKANGNLFHHYVNALAQAAMSEGLVRARPTELKKFLLSRPELWFDKPPEDETLKKYCSKAVKAHYDIKELLQRG